MPMLSAPLHRFDQVGSTNDIALDLAAHGAEDGTAVLADHQRAGRGRHGRDWWSPPGAGMYLSVVIRPADLGSALPVLTLAAGVALATAVRSVSGLPVELKWPNDLVIGRPWRKLAGILCEATRLGTDAAAVVIGLGANLQRSAYPPEIADRATSIAEECGRDVDREALVTAVREALSQQLTRLREGRPGVVLDDWRTWGAVGLDRAPVRWRDALGEHRGIVLGLAEDGALLVRRPGEEPPARLIAGEVHWEMLGRD